MSAHEIYLLLLGLFGALAIISIISALLNEGSARATAILVALSAGFYFLASRSSEEAITLNKLSGAISKLLNLLLG